MFLRRFRAITDICERLFVSNLREYLSVHSRVRLSHCRLCYTGDESVLDSSGDPEPDALLETAAAGLDSRLLDAHSEQRALLVHPRVAWGPNRLSDSDNDQLLAEARSLISSLAGWCVVDEKVLSMRSPNRFSVLGSGQWEVVRDHARRVSATAVIVNVSRLSAAQCCYIEPLLDQRPVWDRYALVLAIIRSHAVSRSARLQVALSELPYLRTRLRASGEYTPVRAELLRQRGFRLRAALASSERSQSPLARQESTVPKVAVVGYTNAGKTSLVAALSGSERAVGRHAVFATLDVSTHHCGRAPLLTASADGERCTRLVRHAYLDTVGFMRQLPAALVEGFRATLREVAVADLLMHVVDVSQPDWRQQQQHVDRTLQQLGLPEHLLAADKQIMVANKCDLLQCAPVDSVTDPESAVCERLLAEGWHCVSAVHGQGISRLLEEVQFQLLRVSGRQLADLAVVTGSYQYQWLLRHCHVLQRSEHLSGDEQLTQFSVAVSQAELAQLRRVCSDVEIQLI